MAERKQWLNNINGNQLISEINIPGTHDTCAISYQPDIPERHIEDPTDRYIACQDMSLKEQLLAGIRFLDLRCRHIKNGFAMHHGEFYLHQTFDVDVLPVCIEFLKANPKEFLIMLVKEEDTKKDCTQTYEQTFDALTEASRGEGLWYLENRIPSIDEVRGKMVLLRRFPGSKGIDATNWPDNNRDFTITIPEREGKLRVQDEYKVPLKGLAGDSHHKWGKVWELFQAVKNENNPSAWYINYSSGGLLPAAVPTDVAYTVNPLLLKYLKENSGRFGTIVMDYPPDGLIGQIVESNSKLQG